MSLLYQAIQQHHPERLGTTQPEPSETPPLNALESHDEAATHNHTGKIALVACFAAMGLIAIVDYNAGEERTAPSALVESLAHGSLSVTEQAVKSLSDAAVQETDAEGSLISENPVQVENDSNGNQANSKTTQRSANHSVAESAEALASPEQRVETIAALTPARAPSEHKPKPQPKAVPVVKAPAPPSSAKAKASSSADSGDKAKPKASTTNLASSDNSGSNKPSSISVQKRTKPEPEPVIKVEKVNEQQPLKEATALASKGKYQEAMATLDAALGNASNRAELLLSKATIFLMRNRLADAERILSEVRPQNAREQVEFHTLKAKIFVQIGRYSAATDQYRAALKLNPRSSVLWQELAQTLSKQGMHRASKQASVHSDTLPDIPGLDLSLKP